MARGFGVLRRPGLVAAQRFLLRGSLCAGDVRPRLCIYMSSSVSSSSTFDTPPRSPFPLQYPPSSPPPANCPHPLHYAESFHTFTSRISSFLQVRRGSEEEMTLLRTCALACNTELQDEEKGGYCAQAPQIQCGPDIDYFHDDWFNKDADFFGVIEGVVKKNARLLRFASREAWRSFWLTRVRMMIFLARPRNNRNEEVVPRSGTVWFTGAQSRRHRTRTRGLFAPWRYSPTGIEQEPLDCQSGKSLATDEGCQWTGIDPEKAIDEVEVFHVEIFSLSQPTAICPQSCDDLEQGREVVWMCIGEGGLGEAEGAGCDDDGVDSSEILSVWLEVQRTGLKHGRIAGLNDKVLGLAIEKQAASNDIVTGTEDRWYGHLVVNKCAME
ncbi:hypothetical protein FB45DRAFT_1135268 [Roridomyces roridus]|uniref:Uncharacterized protein n=1 Tax=Roridomyces roridus TaxID=1738132 RepID=A0AAD7B249_9AGAR|nr:hypothetical protein FB45DRAFT_1135268 [Roridomyces roridus]